MILAREAFRAGRADLFFSLKGEQRTIRYWASPLFRRCDHHHPAHA